MNPLPMLDAAIAWLQGLLFEHAVEPVLFGLGLMRYAEELFDFTEWVVIGALEVALLAAVLPLLERRWGVEPLRDRRAVRTDIVYTLLHRLGGFALLVFALMTPAFDALEGWLRLHGVPRMNLDQVIPGVTDVAIVSFLIYLVVLDFVDYWMHRAQHRFGWWWQLHAVHHSQRQMTFWSDNRNHLLDDLLRDGVLAVVALVVGVAPGQFIALVVATRVLQSVQHANLRWRFGAGERLLVSPSYHRLHHAIGYGHEGPARGVNFGVLFPWWDLMFGTADLRPGFVPTGIRDQLDGRDYGAGFWSQQWLALRRVTGLGR
ncbi:MAG TPA: sterol desaturase family protein [Burkholderiaceae bacterium]|nr:sterol desaturase family protein [Burkholderiaceae bacterium]